MESVPDTQSRARLFFLFLLFFVFGILVSSFLFISPVVASFLILVGFSILIAERIHKKRIGIEALFISIALISFGIGAMRYAVKDFHEPVEPMLSGVVVSEPEDRENGVRFVMQDENGEKVLVSAPIYSAVEYGDMVNVSGRLERPGVVVGEGGERAFDYGAYLAKDDIYWTLSFAEVRVLSKDHGNSFKSTLLKIKGGFVEQAGKILAEPYASLLMGLIVAGRDAMPKDILEEFRRAGVIHIVVLSGFNITLIAEFMRRLFQSVFIFLRINRFPQAASLASIIGVILFVVMTGGGATVVRASIMALVVIIAGFFGRNYSASRALIFAGFLMLLENPKILVFDPSFQLSFLATLGLIYLMPPVEKFFSFVTERFQIREILSQTISTQLAVLPLLVYSMGGISIVSLLANLLILIIVPMTMLIGFLAVSISFVSTVLAWPLSFVSYLLLSWILFVSSILGNLSFAMIKVPSFVAWPILVLYLVLFTAMISSKSLKSWTH